MGSVKEVCVTLVSAVKFYNAAPGNWLLITLASWAIWPGTLWIVGWILESRTVPLWKWQSRALFPGDLMLGVMATSIVGMYSKPVVSGGIVWRWINSPFWWMLIAVLAATFAVVLQHREAPYYEEPVRPRRSRAKWSPTKVWHDIVGYFVSPMVLAGFAFPRLATIIAKLTCPSAVSEDVDFTVAEWIVFFAALAFYGFCAIVWDPKKYPTEDIRRKAAKKRHPDDWEPCWRCHK